MAVKRNKSHGLCKSNRANLWLKMIYIFYEKREQGNINKNFLHRKLENWKSSFLGPVVIVNYFTFKSMAFWWKMEDIGIWKVFFRTEITVEEEKCNLLGNFTFLGICLSWHLSQIPISFLSVLRIIVMEIATVSHSQGSSDRD